MSTNEDVAQYCDGLAAGARAFARNIGLMGEHAEASAARDQADIYDEIAKKIRAVAPDPGTEAMQAIAQHAVLMHRWPWRIDRDWTWEVIAADGVCVAKCMTQERAQAVLDLGARIHAEMEADRATVEAELAELAEETS